MYLQKVTSRNFFLTKLVLFTSLGSMTKITGSGSGAISMRHGSADPDPDPDPHQNVMDPQHWAVYIQYMSLFPCSFHLVFYVLLNCVVDEYL